jgi:hypothetical protein
MRTVTFPFIDRLILTPMEINPAMKKFYPWYALVMLVVFGLQPGGIVFKDALNGGLPFLLLGLISLLAGALFTPLLLPFIPFRSFAVKGWITAPFHLLSQNLCNVGIQIQSSSFYISVFPGQLWSPVTGDTFTGMSGVKKELKVSIPLYILGVVASLILLLVYKLDEWRVL